MFWKSPVSWSALVLPIVTLAFAPISLLRSHRINQSLTQSFVASVESSSIERMPRGMGGRIEEAFATAKEKGEAAFVTFVTAGYPTKDGKLRLFGIYVEHRAAAHSSCQSQILPPFCWPCKREEPR